MKKRAVCMLLIVCLAAATLSGALAAGVPQSVLDACNSVLCIETPYASGTGFVVYISGGGAFVATNNHVVEGSEDDVYLWVDRDTYSHASVVVQSPARDLAVLYLPMELPAAPLTLCPDYQRGDEIFAVGFPGIANAISDTYAYTAEDATITSGIISAVRRLTLEKNAPEIELLQISAAVNPGNSGGPLLNSDGQVVGINTLTVKTAADIYGAVSARELIALIEENGLFPTAPEPKEREAPQWAWYAIGAAALAALVGLMLIRIRMRREARSRLAASPAPVPDAYAHGTDVAPPNDEAPARGPEPPAAPDACAAEPKLSTPRVRAPGKRRRLRTVVIAVLACLLLAGTAWYYVKNYNAAAEALQSLDLADVDRYFRRLPAGGLLFPRESAIAEACRLSEAHAYEDALAVLAPFSDARGMDVLQKELRYRRARQCVQEQLFDDAADLFAALGDYRDSPDQKRSAQYQFACDCIAQENGSYEKAERLLQELSASGYAPADPMLPQLYYAWGRSLHAQNDLRAAYEKLQLAGAYLDAPALCKQLAQEIYARGVSDYRAGDYAEAGATFTLLGDYLRGADYMTLVNAHAQKKRGGFRTALCKLVGFEDAAALLLSEPDIAIAFLQGEWRGGGQSLRVDKNGNMTCSFAPLFTAVDTVRDGAFLAPADGPDGGKAVFSGVVIHENCVQVRNQSDGGTYVLYRQ